MTEFNGQVALVLGATGGIGGEVARTLAARGWRVRALNRDAAKARANAPDLDWVQGDAMHANDLMTAAQGASLIVHAVNPPGYRDWDKLVLPMLDNTIAAARSLGARIVLPGTVYNFGPDAFPVLREDSPQHPVTKKGAIRVEMERRLQVASQSGVSVIIVRAGDFFGPGGANSWFSQGMVTPGKPVNAVKNPARRGVGHQWAYLPDVAETMVRLVECADRLPSFAVYHMDGFWDADGCQMVAAIKRVAGNAIKTQDFPWWIVPLAAPFVTFMRELKEMRYLWQEPLRMSNERLVCELGSEPNTPIDEAVRAALVSLGCLPTAGPATEAGALQAVH
ncbi:Nucleoside-diphosphate-sugar epimerase [Rhizobium tibeticum]|uniref:3-ketoacyl-(Acyl-carrier-protein) reductase n=1 Tax=Rhizobium tibeticum TaxID=501024 RepID=A0A1H8HAJ8_9HYPH|nr:SDR family NAD(P)-dependent oxidoreductase [Rhizobium tibeticum]SEH65206.1 3-ketoacyl-(acyl-carrier-protein) reductase [Rhizobium tibeticum]SEN53252.1 Nucleoside-diphosphate-sugar epimerase [Rhizobium tibeticum]